jgi:hypothetical protein
MNTRSATVCEVSSPRSAIAQTVVYATPRARAAVATLIHPSAGALRLAVFLRTSGIGATLLGWMCFQRTHNECGLII